ncbi:MULTISPECIES: extracellular solute-binding protein [unclassified Curtobacterium]|uniref:extracellular solute-binding protein n=1 Tax=unclassified Curtobacterium TaxID=257496 RepID=UPI000D999E6D|nr:MULTISPECIES: extracellular solute-binding protein [unclassified Curtobacterium]PYY40084.1 ABC transporter substrate-binding protein [Curtobacterium sp. MCPF17_046]WIB16420.1 extracellular solute-binding protein [Curtobacterium sp. MCPF17_050]
MRTTKFAAATAVALTIALGMTACSSAGNAGSGGGGGTKAIADVDGDGKTLTVWAMTGDYSDKTIAAINKEFEAKTGAEVRVQIQQWDGITTKVSTALATNTPPDVLDLGNTQVASYAANGALLDLTPYAKELKQGQTWLDGLSDPATVDGALYGVPGFAGARAVIYNKQMWKDAGITEAPTTYEELTADLDKVKAANTAKDFSAFYMPGQYWYAGMQFVWDAGGEIATEQDGTWKAGFGDAEAQQGLADFAEFANDYSSKASATLNTDSPDMNQVFADEKTSAILSTSGTLGLIEQANPEMTADQLGTFPFPGKSGKTQPVMLGGSDWGVAAKSKNTDLALQWVKIASSPDIQSEYVYGDNGWIPNSTDGIKAADSTLSDVNKGFFTAALNSKATPANSRWADLEGDQSINTLFSSVVSGSKTPEEAAADFDEAADAALNKK